MRLERTWTCVNPGGIWCLGGRLQTDEAAPKAGISLGPLKLRRRWCRCGSSIGLVCGGHAGLVVGGRTEVGNWVVGLRRHGWTNRTDAACGMRSFAPLFGQWTQRLVSFKEERGRSQEVAAAWAISPEVVDSAIPAPCLRVYCFVLCSGQLCTLLFCHRCEKSSSEDTESQTRRGQVVKLKGGGRKEL